LSETALVDSKSSTQWRALPRAARWKMLGAGLVICASISAQVFLVWLRVRLGDPSLPMIGPMPTATLDHLWMALVRVVADEASHARIVNGLAVNAALWGLWVVWFTWRQTKRAKGQSASGEGASGEDVLL